MVPEAVRAHPLDAPGHAGSDHQPVAGQAEAENRGAAGRLAEEQSGIKKTVPGTGFLSSILKPVPGIGFFFVFLDR
jgi:hypothetical protein